MPAAKAFEIDAESKRRLEDAPPSEPNAAIGNGNRSEVRADSNTGFPEA